MHTEQQHARPRAVERELYGGEAAGREVDGVAALDGDRLEVERQRGAVDGDGFGERDEVDKAGHQFERVLVVFERQPIGVPTVREDPLVRKVLLWLSLHVCRVRATACFHGRSRALSKLLCGHCAHCARAFRQQTLYAF